MNVYNCNLKIVNNSKFILTEAKTKTYTNNPNVVRQGLPHLVNTKSESEEFYLILEPTNTFLNTDILLGIGGSAGYHIGDYRNDNKLIISCVNYAKLKSASVNIKFNKQIFSYFKCRDTQDSKWWLNECPQNENSSNDSNLFVEYYVEDYPKSSIDHNLNIYKFGYEQIDILHAKL